MKLKKNKPVTIVLLAFFITSMVLCYFQLKLIVAVKWNSYALKTSDIAYALRYERRALKNDANNPIYYANMGFLYAKADSLNCSSFFEKRRDVYTHYTDSAINCFNKAIELSEGDWLFNLNLALLLLVKGQNIEAEHVMNTSTQRGYVEYPAFTLLGILSERNGDSILAMEWYTKTIIISPAILDSRFFIDLSARRITLANNSVIEAERHLENEYNETGDPLLAAKLGKLKMYFQNYDSAELLLNAALAQLPTLNRPWYYLGRIAEEKNDSVKALKCFRMAANLDPSDILPLLKMSYYDKKYESQLNWMLQYKLSEQSFNLTESYGAKSIDEPYVLSGFEDYIHPFIIEN